METVLSQPPKAVSTGEVNHYTVEAHVQQERDLMEFLYADYVHPPLMLIKGD